MLCFLPLQQNLFLCPNLTLLDQLNNNFGKLGKREFLLRSQDDVANVDDIVKLVEQRFRHFEALRLTTQDLLHSEVIPPTQFLKRKNQSLIIISGARECTSYKFSCAFFQ